MQKLMAQFVMSVLPIVITQLTPAIKAEITKALDDLQVKAKATPNPFDDFAIQVLRTITGL